ncbi:RimK family protein [Marinobacterium arenosum]|uniref:RimK family protein n=1 Tax=Marinobacterium arenosum TaxID=2862496 RepID=UPI001C9746BC|nr:RimK family protein [Marinobacterium arenosum]MBY4677473.1 RimK family protein [Marinobacterium arenosum]
MSSFYVVVDDFADWKPYYPSDDVISFETYLNLAARPGGDRVRVINCCRNTRALGRAYYCSLLAEGRGHHVIPTVQVLNDLRRKSLYSLELGDTKRALDKLAGSALSDSDDEATLRFRVFFGETLLPELKELGKQLFERFACPVLEVQLHHGREWHVEKIQQVAVRDISAEAEQELFAHALERFSSKIWRKPRYKRRYRYELAMLADSQEEMPPSDKTALKRFIKAGNQLGINVELIGKRDYNRLPEYDGLFIRETTSIDHHTYRFARKAEAEGLVVMDDPTSILRCTNKVYLAELLRTHNVPTPNTRIVSRGDRAEMDELCQAFGFPMVLKVPDGSFSRGVVKVNDREQLEFELRQLMQKSALIIAQEYLYTEHDWRIGILNNKPLYACRYYMVRDHWQIYHHKEGGQVASGDFDTLPTYEVPRQVLDAALKASRLIGDGLYGVDLKQDGKRVVVIEVNDNPSIDAGVEDKFLGETLYHEVMAEFLRRMALQKQ